MACKRGKLHARKLEAAGVLSALVSEVEALARLVHHRDFRGGLETAHGHAASLVKDSKGDTPVPWFTIATSNKYWSTYEALTEKIGLIHPYHADRITRFYTLLKALHENYTENSPFQDGVSADVAEKALSNDLMLLHTIMVLAAVIANFRSAKPPKGVHDPLLVGPHQNDPWSYLGEPIMPIDAPRQEES